MIKHLTIATVATMVVAVVPALAQAPTGRVTPEYPKAGSPADRMGIGPNTNAAPISPSTTSTYDVKPSGRPTPGCEGTTSGSTLPPGVEKPPPMKTN